MASRLEHLKNKLINEVLANVAINDSRVRLPIRSLVVCVQKKYRRLAPSRFTTPLS